MTPRAKSPSRLSGELALPSHDGRSFQLLFHEAVVSGVTEVLGSAGARAAFFHLKLIESADADEVHNGLSRIFGMGTQVLESSILKVLYVRVGSAFAPEESLTFSEYVAVAQKLYSNASAR